jgi:hypothetical protein
MATSIYIVSNNIGGMTNEEREQFKKRWEEVTDMVYNYRKSKVEKTYLNGFHIALESEKPSMLKASSGVTYLGNGKAVKYV